MIVLVEEIGPRGLALERELSLGFLTEVLAAGAAPTGFSAAAPGSVRARLEKVSGKILLTASGQVSVKGECKRCLTAAQVEVPLSFTLSLVRRAAEAAQGAEPDDERRGGKGRKEPEVPPASFDLEAVEEEPYDGRQIELGGILREQILLALPMDLLCREDCKGLCPVCGKDLNQEACGCQKASGDPRWAALQGLRGR